VALSLKTTASKLLKEAMLVKPPKLTRALFKKSGGLPAISAILLGFPKHAGIRALAHSEVAGDVADFAKAYQKTYGEAVTKLGQRQAAQKLVDAFVLAAPNPTEAECKLSLGVTIDVLNRP